MTTLAFIPGGLGMTELIVIGVFGLLIFGKRLPEVARNLGKGIVEFKKGVKGIEDDVDRTSTSQYDDAPRSSVPEPTPQPTAPAFEPHDETPVGSGEDKA